MDQRKDKEVTMIHSKFLFLPVMILAFAVPSLAAKWSMTPLAGNEAIAEFRRICVDNFLDENALSTELASEESRWVELKPLPKGYIRSGRYWRSSTGEVGYVSVPGYPKDINDPACHFTFVRNTRDTHGSLIALAVKYLKLGVGRDTGKSKIDQRRWDFENVGGVKARIFVTSNLKSDGLIVSRFSISKHRLSKSASKAN
jgi:hypothetical protein